MELCEHKGKSLKFGEHLYYGVVDGRGKDKLKKQKGNWDQPMSRKPRNVISWKTLINDQDRETEENKDSEEVIGNRD